MMEERVGMLIVEKSWKSSWKSSSFRLKNWYGVVVAIHVDEEEFTVVWFNPFSSSADPLEVRHYHRNWFNTQKCWFLVDLGQENV